jgi:hypothetical protein
VTDGRLLRLRLPVQTALKPFVDDVSSVNRRSSAAIYNLTPFGTQDSMFHAPLSQLPAGAWLQEGRRSRVGNIVESFRGYEIMEA